MDRKDGNGRSDILWQNDGGNVAISDNGVVGHTISSPGILPSTWHIVGVGDFDGNHHSDILWDNDSGAVAICDKAVVGHNRLRR